MSSKKQNFLGMDYGAGSGRGMLGSFDGERLELREVTRFLNGSVPDPDGGLRWDIDRLYNEMKNTLLKLKKEGVEISSVAIDTWAQDHGLINPDGSLYAKPYCYRTPFFGEGAALVGNKFSDAELFGKTGSIFSTVTALSQILSVRDRASGYYEGKKLLFMANLLGYLLTGEMSCDCTVPSMSIMFDNSRKCWSDEILEAYKIDKAMFADMIPHFEKVGFISDPDLVSQGYGKTPLISIAHHDTVSAFSAIESMGSTDDTVYISCGTWTVIGIPIKEAVLSEEAFKAGMCNEMGLDGKLFLAKNLTGMWIEQECQRYWREKGMSLDYAYLDNYVLNGSKDDIIIDTQLPVFASPGNMPEKIRNYCRETGQRVPETVEDIFAAIMHNMSRDYAKTIKEMLAFTPVKAKKIQVVGGGAKNFPLCCFLSEALDLSLVAGPVEATVTGNIIAQMRASGAISSMSEAGEIIKRSFPINEFSND